jgi:hypothetical protein
MDFKWEIADIPEWLHKTPLGSQIYRCHYARSPNGYYLALVFSVVGSEKSMALYQEPLKKGRSQQEFDTYQSAMDFVQRLISENRVIPIVGPGTPLNVGSQIGSA